RGCAPWTADKHLPAISHRAATARGHAGLELGAPVARPGRAQPRPCLVPQRQLPYRAGQPPNPRLVNGSHGEPVTPLARPARRPARKLGGPATERGKEGPGG